MFWSIHGGIPAWDALDWLTNPSITRECSEPQPPCQNTLAIIQIGILLVFLLYLHFAAWENNTRVSLCATKLSIFRLKWVWINRCAPKSDDDGFMMSWRHTLSVISYGVYSQRQKCLPCHLLCLTFKMMGEWPLAGFVQRAASWWCGGPEPGSMLGDWSAP